MTFDLADLIGLVGSAIMIVAYGYSNIASRMNFVLFNLLNLLGAGFLIASLLVHFNFASMLLEVVWAAIAVLGLVKAVRRRARA